MGGKRGTTIDWIGCKLAIESECIRATVLADTRAQLAGIIKDFLQCNMTQEKASRSLTGKLNKAALLLTVWRPFMAELWAALNSPISTVWTRQVKHSLFLELLGRVLRRH